MTDASDTARPARSSRRGLIGALVALTVVGGLVGLVIWAVATSRAPRVQAPPATFERYEAAWSSAMAKAGVEATFPAQPVDITQLRASGSRPFETTFTAEEVTALMNVYRFESDIGGQGVSFRDAESAFPQAGVGVLAGTLVTGDTPYDARIEGPISYSATGIDSTGATSLVVSGFTITGERRRQATDAVVAYLNLYVQAAPGLILERAQIVEGGLSVKGSAPQRLENPSPPPGP